MMTTNTSAQGRFLLLLDQSVAHHVAKWSDIARVLQQLTDDLQRDGVAVGLYGYHWGDQDACLRGETSWDHDLSAAPMAQVADPLMGLADDTVPAGRLFVLNLTCQAVWPDAVRRSAAASLQQLRTRGAVVAQVHLARRRGRVERFPSAGAVGDDVGGQLVQLATAVPAAFSDEAPPGASCSLLRAGPDDVAQLAEQIRGWTRAHWRRRSPSSAAPTRLVWRTELAAGPVNQNCLLALPEGGAIVTAGSDVSRLDLAGTCVWKWSVPTGARVVSGPLLGADQQLRVHAEDERLYLLDINHGALAQAAVPAGVPLGGACPLALPSGATIVVNTEGLALIPAGREAAASRLYAPTPLNSAGVLIGTRLFLGGESHRLHCVDVAGDRLAWVWPLSGEQGLAGGPLDASVAVGSDGCLIVRSRDDFLYGFQPDGRLHWRSGLGGRLLANPVIDAEGRLYQGVTRAPRGQSAEARLVCVDPRRLADQQVVWERQCPGPLEATPAIGDDGRVYVGDARGTVMAVEPDGQVAWMEHLKGRIAALAFIGEGQLLVAFADTVASLCCDARGPAPAGWPTEHAHGRCLPG